MYIKKYNMYVYICMYIQIVAYAYKYYDSAFLTNNVCQVFAFYSITYDMHHLHITSYISYLSYAKHNVRVDRNNIDFQLGMDCDMHLKFDSIFDGSCFAFA